MQKGLKTSVPLSHSDKAKTLIYVFFLFFILFFFSSQETDAVLSLVKHYVVEPVELLCKACAIVFLLE